MVSSPLPRHLKRQRNRLLSELNRLRSELKDKPRHIKLQRKRLNAKLSRLRSELQKNLLLLSQKRCHTVDIEGADATDGEEEGLDGVDADTEEEDHGGGGDENGQRYTPLSKKSCCSSRPVCDIDLI